MSGGFDEATGEVTVYVAPVRIPLTSVTAGLGGFVIDGQAPNNHAGHDAQ